MATDVALEVAHVLFMDVVGYSKLLINDQSEVLAQLNQVVRATAHFQKAEAEGKLIRLATGDGIALIFFNNAEAGEMCDGNQPGVAELSKYSIAHGCP